MKMLISVKTIQQLGNKELPNNSKSEINPPMIIPNAMPPETKASSPRYHTGESSSKSMNSMLALTMMAICMTVITSKRARHAYRMSGVATIIVNTQNETPKVKYCFVARSKE